MRPFGEPGRNSTSARHGVRRARSNQAGVTLIEMLIVLTLIALIIGISFPAAASGIESLRLRSSADTIVNFLETGIERAERRQQVIEVWISPQENLLIERSPDLAFNRRLEIPPAFRITSILPAAEVAPGEPRRFLLYPGGSLPRIAIELSAESGRKRLIHVDPLSGIPSSELEPQ